MERELPNDLVLGRRTPDFTEVTVPPALLGEHHTSRWARLEVSVGSVRFLEIESGWRGVAAPGEPIVIVPNRVHRVEPSIGAVFAVQFFVDPAKGD